MLYVKYMKYVKHAQLNFVFNFKILHKQIFILPRIFYTIINKYGYDQSVYKICI